VKTNGAHLNALDSEGCGPLSTAVLSGQIASVEALISLRADVDAATQEGLTALHWAAVNGCSRIAACLLEAQANHEQSGTYLGQDRQVLHIAAREGHAEIVQLLLAHRAHVEARSGTGATALFFAASTSQAEVAAVLLGALADPDGQCHDATGRTPLMRAVHVGSVSVVGLLLAALADPSKEDSDGFTCYDYENSAQDNPGSTDPGCQRLLSAVLRRSRSVLSSSPSPAREAPRIQIHQASVSSTDTGRRRPNAISPAWAAPTPKHFFSPFNRKGMSSEDDSEEEQVSERTSSALSSSCVGVPPPERPGMDNGAPTKPDDADVGR